MLRKLILVVCAISLTLASCGHQVTPNRANTFGIPSGFMQIKFSTQGSLDFTNNWYILAINQEGQEPYAARATQLYNYQNLDFEVIVYDQNGVPTAQIYPFVTEKGSTGNTIRVPSPTPILYLPQDLQLNPNCNQLGTQFCITVNRSLFVIPGASPSPSPTGSACPTSAPTASPSPTGSPSSSPSPSASPSATPCPSSSVWAINWWVASPGTPSSQPGGILDAPGLQGINDLLFTFTVNTGANVDTPWYAVAGWPQVASQSAQIAGGEVLNVP